MKIIMIFGFSFALALILTEVIVILYNALIGFPLSFVIEKQKRYKTVKATKINLKEDVDEWKKGKHWFKFEWKINNKKYKRLIHTSKWVAGPYETFYYLNPKYATPTPRELAKYKYEIQTFFISWIICFYIFMKYYNF